MGRSSPLRPHPRRNHPALLPLDRLLARLADIPTPAGPRCEIGALGARPSFRAWISAHETALTFHSSRPSASALPSDAWSWLQTEQGGVQPHDDDDGRPWEGSDEASSSHLGRCRHRHRGGGLPSAGQAVAAAMGRPTRNTTPPGDDLIANPDLTPGHHRACPSRPGLALDRPARAGTGRLLQLRRAGEPGRLRHPQRRPHRAPVAGPQGRRPGLGCTGRLGTEACRWSRAGRWSCVVACNEGAAPLNDFTWVFWAAWSGRRGRPGCWSSERYTQPVMGAVAGRAGCGGRLRDDDRKNASADDSAVRYARWPPANGMNWAGEVTMGQFAGDASA